MAKLAMFLLSPLGKRVAFAAALMIFFGFTIRTCQKNRDELMVMKGQRQAWSEMQKINEANWAEVRAIVEAQRAAAEEQLAIAREDQRAFMKKQAETKTVVQEHQATFDAKHEANREEVEAALPNTPEPVIEELATYREEVATLRADIVELTTLLDEAEVKRTTMEAAYVAQVDSLQAELAQMQTERDFYKNAFEGSAPKKGRGFWKKLGCGLRAVGTLGISTCKP